MRYRVCGALLFSASCHAHLLLPDASRITSRLFSSSWAATVAFIWRVLARHSLSELPTPSAQPVVNLTVRSFWRPGTVLLRQFCSLCSTRRRCTRFVYVKTIDDWLLQVRILLMDRRSRSVQRQKCQTFPRGRLLFTHVNSATSANHSHSCLNCGVLLAGPWHRCAENGVTPEL